MRALLMGGQACILYGAAEFSRDADLAVLASPANLARLRKALDDLQAQAGLPRRFLALARLEGVPRESCFGPFG